MAGKNKVKAKSPKTSKIKLANKKQYKFGKQGITKKLKLKQKKKLAKKLRDAQAGDHSLRKQHQDGEANAHQEEEELPLEDQDVKFYSTPLRDTSFTHSLNTSSLKEGKGNKKKRKQETTDDEALYEKVPRMLPANKRMKMLLPIKDQNRIIPQMIEQDAVPEEEEEENETKESNAVHENGDVSESEEPLPALSNIELFVLRRRKLAEKKQKIAVCAFAVMENPQENMKKLRELCLMLHEDDPGIFVTVRSWAMVSLVDVFKDIIPSYKIRLPTDKEKQQKMAAETKALQQFETALLLNYKKYLEYLEFTSRGKIMEMSSKKPQKKNGQIHHNNLPKQLSALAVKCLGQLLIAHPHFNYATNIITVLVPFMNRTQEFSDRVCEDVKTIFQQDKTGEVTLEIVRCIGKMIKTRNFQVKPKILDTFLSLKIKEIDLSSQEQRKDGARRKEQLLKMSRKQRKHQKQLEKLEGELKEIRATEDKQKKLKLHTEVMNAVFVTYFRILKQARRSGLLASVLEGLAKFAHLINVDFFDDLFTVFKDILESGELNYRQSLQCIQTAFTILSGQGAALNIDPMNFYRHLYKKLLQIHAGSESKDMLIILNCLDLMINKRKRQVSQQRILAFLKRLCTICLQQLPHSVLGILSAVRSLVHNHKYTDIVFDNEAQGSGVYLPELDDPEHCNAHNSTLWEITTLRNHFHPVVRKYASHVSKFCPSTGDGQLIPELARLSPMILFQKYDMESEIFDLSIPQQINKLNRKRQTLESSNDVMKKHMKQVLEKVPDSLQNFSLNICLSDNG